jgi:hypothetical protein
MSSTIRSHKEEYENLAKFLGQILIVRTICLSVIFLKMFELKIKQNLAKLLFTLENTFYCEGDADTNYQF